MPLGSSMQCKVAALSAQPRSSSFPSFNLAIRPHHSLLVQVRIWPLPPLLWWLLPNLPMYTVHLRRWQGSQHPLHPTTVSWHPKWWHLQIIWDYSWPSNALSHSKPPHTKHHIPPLSTFLSVNLRLTLAFSSPGLPNGPSASVSTLLQGENFLLKMHHICYFDNSEKFLSHIRPKSPFG